MTHSTFVVVPMQLITQIPFTGTGDTTNYADDYLIKTCTHSSGAVETVGSPVRHVVARCHCTCIYDVLI